MSRWCCWRGYPRPLLSMYIMFDDRVALNGGHSRSYVCTYVVAKNSYASSCGVGFFVSGLQDVDN